MSLPAELPRSSALSRYCSVRKQSEALCEPLHAEDMVVQSMPDVSPTKWHLAHTTWFFETFVLEAFASDFEPFEPAFRYLFNSYYEAVGERHPRARRGVVTRPTVDRVFAYRAATDERICRLIESASDDQWAEIATRLTLGLHHEQQHQELMLMDIKHVLFQNPTFPAYVAAGVEDTRPALRAGWFSLPGGVVEVGHAGFGFAFDNEGPRHQTFLYDFGVATRPVTNGEYLAFVNDGGYDNHEHWLSDGWFEVQSRGWRAPEYWVQRDGAWFEYTLGGLTPLDPEASVVHVSWYEADAFARWTGHRLPHESEWERAAQGGGPRGPFLEAGARGPGRSPAPSGGTASMLGGVWELTQSPYVPYPGYRAPKGALGEYNGKFMANQYVCRGGSFGTPQSHVRPTYRNFFYPHQRWAFQGFRLARDET